MGIERVGVVGAGVMGAGVAQNLAQTGHRAVLLDLGPPALERARTEIARNVRFHGMLGGKRGGPGAEEVLENVTFTTDYADLADVDFVIENVTEKWEARPPSTRGWTRSARRTAASRPTPPPSPSPGWRGSPGGRNACSGSTS
jgi:3-hydroxyacyl-CoA dehydrogenase